MIRNILIASIFLVVGVLVLRSVSQDVSTYATFTQSVAGQRVKIVGQLSKDKSIDYDPEKAPNMLTFFMKDADGIENRVVLHKPKPQDFEMSEQIVVTGEMVGGSFEADEILMKCPSKYKNEEIAVKDQKG